jgi:hypothetical protein
LDPVDAPDLRIIPQELWKIVEARFASAKAKSRSVFRDQDSKYFLTGMARCAHCGVPMTIVGGTTIDDRAGFRVARMTKAAGPIWKNSLLGEQEYVDQIVLSSLQAPSASRCSRSLPRRRSSIIGQD